MTIEDATHIQKYLADLESFTPAQEKAADADGNGSITINDVTTIQKYIAKIIDTLG